MYQVQLSESCLCLLQIQVEPGVPKEQYEKLEKDLSATKVALASALEQQKRQTGIRRLSSLVTRSKSEMGGVSSWKPLA